MTKKVNDGLHSLEDTPTTTHNFVNEQVVLPQEKQKSESSSTIKLSYSATEKNAERKHALVEMKGLEKKQLEEEQLLREKENLQLLEKQRHARAIATAREDQS